MVSTDGSSLTFYTYDHDAIFPKDRIRDCISKDADPNPGPGGNGGIEVFPCLCAFLELYSPTLLHRSVSLLGDFRNKVKRIIRSFQPVLYP